jgi:hypothetical protein
MKRWLFTLLILGAGCLMLLLGFEGRRQLLLQGMAVTLGAPMYYLHGPGGIKSTKLPPLSMAIVIAIFSLLFVALCIHH